MEWDVEGAGCESCFELLAWSVSCRGIRADRDRYTPFDSEGIFQHFDSTHEVDFDILERASLAL